MCIIAIKPAGIAIPDVKTIETMYRNNPDGAGLMYSDGAAVHIRKGYMSLKAYKAAIKELEKEIDTLWTPIVFHCRIGTHGKNIAENTHPFPVSDKLGLLRKIRTKTSLGVAHNGIIDITPGNKDISDTMEYITSQLAPLSRLCPNFYLKKDGLKLVSNAIQSKMVFLDVAGNIETIGEFEEVNGIFYSNSSYLPHISYKSWNYWDFDYTTRKSAKKTAPDILDILPLMWLCEDDFVITETGEYIDGEDCMLGENGEVYRIDYYSDGAYHIPNAAAFNGAGHMIMYDENDAEYMEIVPAPTTIKTKKGGK